MHYLSRLKATYVIRVLVAFTLHLKYIVLQCDSSTGDADLPASSAGSRGDCYQEAG